MKLLEIIYHEPGILKTLIEVLKDLIPEANIDFISNGEEKTMKILATDRLQTILINLQIDGNNFCKFECAKEELTLGVNMANLFKFIKSVDKDDLLKLFVDSDNVNNLNIVIESMNIDSKQENQIRLMDLEENKFDVGEMKFEAIITMDSSEFHKTCRDMNTCSGENIEILCLKDKLELKCNSVIGNRKWIYKNSRDSDNLTPTKNKKKIGIKILDGAPDAVQGVFNLKNIILFNKCQTLSTKIHLFLKNDYPLVIKYKVGMIGDLLIALSPANTN